MVALTPGWRAEVPTTVCDVANQEESPQAGQILVVEDNSDVAEVLKDLLEGEGYQVELASSMALALQRIRAVDLTLLDVVLPDGNALDLCRLIRATPDLSRHPIILLSARGSATDRARGLK